jgi:hypothetical protein
MDYNRKYIKSQSDSDSALATEYLIKENNSVSIEHDQKLFCIFQFSNFTRKLESPSFSQYFFAEGKKYIIGEFYLADFMKFIKIPSSNSHERTKLVDSFENFHNTEPIVKQFADETFHIFATFLY